MDAQNQIHGKELLKVQAGGRTKNLMVLRGDRTARLFEAHPLVESFNREHGTGLSVVSHEVADAAITTNQTSLQSFPVDASIAYEKPDTRLGKEIVFSVEGEPRVVLATGKYQGEKDAALVTLGLTSADVAYKMNGKTRVLQEILQAVGIDSLLTTNLNHVSEIQLLLPNDRLILVPDFPRPTPFPQMYLPHEQTGVPHGKPVFDHLDGARQLYTEYEFPQHLPGKGTDSSTSGHSYVGLLVRNGDFNFRWGVFADCRAGYNSGRSRIGLDVVAEVPDADVPKIQALIDKQKEV